MPARNTIREDVPASFYHVYSRGVSKLPIFLDGRDYAYFMGLFARYLSNKPAVSKDGYPYPHYRDMVELNAFCLMSNHFHLMLYQYDKGDTALFMKSLISSYTRYFNLRHKRTGPLFETRYKASRITSDHYLMHISRYIHLNPRYYKQYAYSSITNYADHSKYEWLTSGPVLELFSSPQAYKDFCDDYVERRDVLAQAKAELANL